jgi:uncharacterized protein
LQLEQLIGEVLGLALTRDSSLHGPAHWRRVARFGERLVAWVPGADQLVVLLFAVLHDSMRLNDGYDPGHGPRAAALARELNGGPFDLGRDRIETLAQACHRHADGEVSGEPTLGVCWDADRLDLWRVGIAPDPSLLSTAVARRPTVIECARRVRR